MMSLREVSELFQLSAQTLRDWERRGLMQPALRSGKQATRMYDGRAVLEVARVFRRLHPVRDDITYEASAFQYIYLMGMLLGEPGALENLLRSQERDGSLLPLVAVRHLRKLAGMLPEDDQVRKDIESLLKHNRFFE